MYNKSKSNRSVPKYICEITKPVTNPIIKNEIVVKDDEKGCVQEIIKKFDSARVNIVDMTTKKEVKKMNIKDRYKELVKK